LGLILDRSGKRLDSVAEPLQSTTLVRLMARFLLSRMAPPDYIKKTSMPAKIHYEANGICVVRCSGTIKESEFVAIQRDVAGKIELGLKPRMLAILENFEGWERGADWNDLDFMMSYGDDIEKIAIVGEADWEGAALSFAGAG